MSPPTSRGSEARIWLSVHCDRRGKSNLPSWFYCSGFGYKWTNSFEMSFGFCQEQFSNPFHRTISSHKTSCKESLTLSHSHNIMSEIWNCPQRGLVKSALSQSNIWPYSHLTIIFYCTFVRTIFLPRPAASARSSRLQGDHSGCLDMKMKVDF